MCRSGFGCQMPVNLIRFALPSDSSFDVKSQVLANAKGNGNSGARRRKCAPNVRDDWTLTWTRAARPRSVPASSPPSSNPSAILLPSKLDFRYGNIQDTSSPRIAADSRALPELCQRFALRAVRACRVSSSSRPWLRCLQSS